MPASADKKERELLLGLVKSDTALWRAEAWASYAQVEGEAERAELCGSDDDEKRICQVRIVRQHLGDALDAMALLDPIDEKDASHPALATIWRWFGRIPAQVKLYYSGADIERTWTAIHSASAALFMAYDESELPAQAARLRGLLSALPNLDWQLALVTEIINELKQRKEPKRWKRRDKRKEEVSVMRARLRQFHLDAMDAASSLQVEARTLRNTLLVASGALFLVLLLLGFTHMLNGCIFRICTKVGDHTVCPGGSSAHSVDVFTVELAGMLGGLLSAVIPLATGERIKTPYRVFNHQMLLKVFAGAATALAGVLLVQSHVISQIKFGSTATLLGYAVFFGFSQQVLTGLIDKRANELGKETPTAKSV